MIGLATIVGPLAGGALIALNIASLDWRTIFYVNVPIGVLAGTAAFFRLSESRSPDAPRLDMPGALLISGALFLLVYPLTEGRQMGWPPWVLIMLVLALVVFVVYGFYEVRRTRQGRWPLLHASLFKGRAFRVGALLSVVFFAGVAPFFFVLTLYLQIGFGFSALHAGLTTFPFAVGSALGAAGSEKLTARLGKRVLNIGSLVLVAGMLLTIAAVHAAGLHLASWQLTPAFTAAGLGLGLFVAPVINIILAGIRGEAAGSASGVLSTAQQVGGVLGIALIGVIFFGLIASNAVRASNEVTPTLRGDLTAAHLPASAIDQVVDGFQTCFIDRAQSS
ncbi:MAG: MFS transporter, partial [Acidimicrobiales bacterium]